MNNRWTGGQYSLYRIIFGLYLLTHFFQLLPWSGELFSNQGMIPDHHLSPLMHLFPNILSVNDSHLFTIILTVLGMIGSFFYIIGKWDRISALVLWYILACFSGRNPLIMNPSLPFVGWLLLAHIFLPKAPFGSLAAKARIHPSGNWSMTPSLFFAAWCIMAIAYTYSGITKLSSPSWVDGTAFFYLIQNPLARCNVLREFLILMPPIILKIMTWSALGLEVGFAFFVIFKRLRPLVWTCMVFMHVSLLSLVNFADLTLGMLMFHLFTFDPNWIKPYPVNGKLTVYYDGNCGFCHSFVRFVLSESQDRDQLSFKPLQERFSLDSIPKSVVVEVEGCLLFKSQAIFLVLNSLGGLWRVIAFLLSRLPIKFCDLAYDVIAKNRHRLFAKPKEICPVIPVEMRKFFKSIE